MDSLPIELHSKIIKSIFNCVIHQYEASKKDIDQKKLEAYVLKTPIELGVKFVNEFDYLQTLCQSKIGNKQFLARQLFVLSREERDIFIGIANRSVFLKGNVSEQDYKILQMTAKKDILKGLTLKVNYINRTAEYLDHGATVILLIGALSTFKNSSEKVLSFDCTPTIFFGCSVLLKCIVEVLNIFNSHYNARQKWRIRKETL